jgi:hypothetical protein
MANADNLFAEMLDQSPDDANIDEGPRVPHITWKFGNKGVAEFLEGDALDTVAYRGGWFLADDTISRFSINETDLAENGWKRDKFTVKAGKVEGWSIRTLEARLIRSRRRWIKTGNESGALTWNAGFDFRQEGGKARAHLQVIALPRGLEKYGPFTLTMKGSAQMAWYGVGAWRGEGVLESIRSTLVASGNKLANSKGKGFHYMAFYAPIGVTYIEEGKGKSKQTVPNFIEMGQGSDTTFVVVPSVVYPDDFDAGPEMTAEHVAPFMQPRETYAQATELFAEYEDWSKEWDDEDGVGSNDEPAHTDDAEEVKAEADHPFEDAGLNL